MRKGWTRMLAAIGVWGVLAVAGVPAAHSEEPGILDEYNADLTAGSDFQRLALGLSFGQVKESGFWWNYGARAGSFWFDNGRVNEQGWVVGGTVGLGFDPSRKVSPVAGFSLDVPFGAGDIDLVSQVHAGARIRLNDAPDHFALTVAAFWSGLFVGGGSADGSDGGIAVLFSAASLRPR